MPSFSTMRPPREQPGHFAMLIESLDDEYEIEAVTGAVAGARGVDATLLCVAGAAIDDADPNRAAMNFVFDLVDQRNAKGIIVLSSAIGSNVGPRGLQRFLERYEGLPVCCVGVRVEGYPHVGVDNYSGLRSVMEHLIEVHRARRIAFIRGPQDSSEAEDRYRAYVDALASASLEFESHLVVDGDFSKEAGVAAIKELLDEGSVRAGFDSVVAANDYMALGAMTELSRRGLKVPEDVRVVGFDDVDSAAFARPELTTVRQPIEQLGREGALLLDRALRREAQSDSTVLDTELRVRHSCGCEQLGLDGALSVRGIEQNAGRSLEALLVQRRPIILAELMRAGQGALGTAGRGWEARLLDAVIEEIRGDAGEALALAVERLIHKLERSDVDSMVLQHVLSALRAQLLVLVGTSDDARDRLEHAVHEARIVVSHATSRVVEASLRREAELFDRFDLCFHQTLFGKRLHWGPEWEEPLRALGVEACVVAALNEPGDHTGDATVLVGFGAGAPRSGETTRLWALPHHPALQRISRCLFLLPLLMNGTAAGAAVVASSAIKGALLHNLRARLETLIHVHALRRAVEGNSGES